jgi:hypothetical protein
MVQLYHAALDMPSYLSRGMEMGVHNFKWISKVLDVGRYTKVGGQVVYFVHFK